MSRRHHLILLSIAVVFVALHAVRLPTTLEDEDSVNLAFGVEDYNVRSHQPHPPGYPVYVALGKVSTPLVRLFEPEWSRDRVAAAGLAWIGIVAGALGVWVLTAFWRELGVPPWWAIGMATVTVASPLFWFTAARPLTDVPGVVAALAVHAGLFRGWRRWRETGTLPAIWIVSAIGAGLAIGIRSQSMWLTGPLLVFIVAALVRQRAWRAGVAMTLAAMAGALAWAVPLVVHTGGLSEFLRALDSQADGDFRGVQMLATSPSWTLLFDDLRQTLLDPWRLTAMPWLWIVLCLAGIAMFLKEHRRTFAWVVLAAVPYLVFHVLFHEVEMIRYSLPTTVMVAGLATYALRPMGLAGGLIAAVASVVMTMQVWPAMTDYHRGAPVFLALQDIREARADSGAPLPLLEAHHMAWWATDRAIQWYRDEGLPRPPRIHREESLRLLRYWQSGETRSVHFLASRARTDLYRFSAEDAAWQGSYRLSPQVRALMAGLRQYEVDWWVLQPPRWMLEHGWATSPELAIESGVQKDTQATAWLRRSSSPTRVLIEATRHDSDPAIDGRLVARLDGVVVHTWHVSPASTMQEWLTMPSSISDVNAYAELTIAWDVERGTPPDIQLTQFAAAPADTALAIFGPDWSGLQYDDEGRFWRRSNAVSSLQVLHGGQPVRLTIHALSTREDFPSPPRVMLLAGGVMLGSWTADTDADMSVDLSPAILDGVNGQLTLAVEQPRAPQARTGGVSERESGLRVTRVTLRPVASR